MRLWHLLRARLRSLFLRRGREAEMGEELAFHLEREAERLEALGVAPEEARRQARRTFGGIEKIKEECRDARGTSALETLARDTRDGVRRLRRDWRFSTAAVLILGLGIGANTAIFSLINAVLWRDAAIAEPEDLVELYQNASNPGGLDGNSYPAYLDMAAYTDVFAGVTAALVPIGVSYQDRARPLRPATVEHTTASYPSVLGLTPALGRWFTPAEDARGAAVVAVLSHQAWTQRFGADPLVVGRVIQIEGVPVTIVGVGPAGHNGTLNMGAVTDFWLPVSSLPALWEDFGRNAFARRPDEAAFFVKARLRDGVTIAQAQAAMDILGRRLATEYPREDPGRGIRVIASKDVRIHPQFDGPLTAIASVVLVIVGLVLAVACSNLATLLLVRGAARAKEVSIRLAIGATRWQLVRQLLTESLLLSAAGGACGGVLAWWGIQWLRAIELPVTIDLTLDWRVLAFAVGVSAVTGLAFGLAPALTATRPDVLPTLRDDSATQAVGHRRLTVKNALIVFQVAVSVLLLGAASLFLQWIDATREQPLGYAVDGVAMLETDLRYAGGVAGGAEAVSDELRRRMSAIPGVEAAAITRGLPMRLTGQRLVVERTGGGEESADGVAMIWAAPGFFDTLRIPLLYGRDFDARDRAGTPRVAVINESMARRWFGTGNAVGRRFRHAADPGSWREVVGVVRDTGTDLTDPVPHLFYQPVAQGGVRPTTIVARTSQGAEGLLAAMQRELRAVDARLPVVAAKTMARDRVDALKGTQAIAAFLGGLGALGLLLASLGLYAVIAFAVSRSLREIGIRLALGAHGRQVVWSVSRGVVGLVGIGTAVGLLLSVLATLALRASYAPAPGLSLYRPAVDPVALAGIAAIMAGVAAAAAFGPARRAVRTDPLVALRHD